jgi:hypothetical protein
MQHDCATPQLASHLMHKVVAVEHVVALVWPKAASRKKRESAHVRFHTRVSRAASQQAGCCVTCL